MRFVNAILRSSGAILMCLFVLIQVCIDFASAHIIPKLQLKDVFHVWFQYATKCYHEQLINSCIQALSEKMDDITFSLGESNIS